jgi:hypothetical protein
MNKIIESEVFDIILAEHKDYRGVSIYRLYYGLQVESFDCLKEAINSFNGCISHALECGGY